MISRLLLPSAERLATYSLVRRSRPIRTMQIMYNARLASRLPPRLRRCRTTLPEEAWTGETPQRLAKEASLFNLSGLSLNAWCELSGRDLRGRCPFARVGLLPDPQGKGTDSSWSMWTPSSPHFTSRLTTSATLNSQREGLVPKPPSPTARS